MLVSQISTTPTGKRNYARLSTTDDIQGAAAAQFAFRELHVKSVYVLNDTQAYGQGVAAAFTTEAKKIGITVLSSGASGEGWDVKQSTYEALMLKIKSLKPDMIYVAGVFENNGGQLIKDKVAVLGDNTKVKLMGPNGFTGYPDLNKMPEADGMYLSFTGLTADQLPKVGAGAQVHCCLQENLQEGASWFRLHIWGSCSPGDSRGDQEVEWDAQKCECPDLLGQGHHHSSEPVSIGKDAPHRRQNR